MSISFSDDFSATNSPLPSPWVTVSTVSVFLSTGGNAVNGVNNATPTCMGYTGSVAAEYSKIIVGATVSGNTDEGVGPACRIGTATGNAIFGQGGADTRVYTHTGTNWNANYTQIGTTGAAVVATDVLTLWCVTSGSDVIVHFQKNGTDICGSPITVTGGNTNFGSGVNGMWEVGSSTNSIASWEDGTVAGGSATMTATAQTFSETGNAAALTWAHVVIGTTATFSMTGNDALLGVLQILHPTSDITTNGWTSTGANLFSTLDEVNPDDADYITSPANPTGELAEVKFSAATDPQVSTGHIIRYRLASLGQNAQITVALYCGATSIASWTQGTTADAAPITYEQTLTGGQADAITDYTDLRVRFSATA